MVYNQMAGHVGTGKLAAGQLVIGKPTIDTAVGEVVATINLVDELDIWAPGNWDWPSGYWQTDHCCIMSRRETGPSDCI